MRLWQLKGRNHLRNRFHNRPLFLFPDGLLVPGIDQGDHPADAYERCLWTRRDHPKRMFLRLYCFLTVMIRDRLALIYTGHDGEGPFPSEAYIRPSRPRNRKWRLSQPQRPSRITRVEPPVELNESLLECRAEPTPYCCTDRLQSKRDFLFFFPSIA